jgi:hypothetical protein
LKFEKFSGTNEAGKYVPETIDRTNISQGSRADANGIPRRADGMESIEARLMQLTQRTCEIDAELGNYTNAQKNKLSHDIFQSMPRSAAQREWNIVHARFDAERQALVREKQSAVAEIQELRPLVSKSRHQQYLLEKDTTRGEVIQLATEIRDLLRVLVERGR